MKNFERRLGLHTIVLAVVVLAIVAAFVIEGVGVAVIVALGLGVVLAIGWPLLAILAEEHEQPTARRGPPA